MIQVTLHSMLFTNGGFDAIIRAATFPALPPVGAVLILDGIDHFVDAIAFRADGGDPPEVTIQSIVRLPQMNTGEALDLFRKHGWDVVG